MGGDICKSCDNYLKVEEKNLTGNFKIKKDNNSNNNTILPNSQFLSSTIKIRQISSLNNDVMKSTIIKTTKNDEIPLSPKVVVDNKELDKILCNYKIRFLISSFRKFKKMKDEAHKIIIFRNNLKEKRNEIMIEGNEYLDVNLFPSEIYNYLGNIFNNKEDGFGIQYFPENNAKYVGKFFNGKRKEYGLFEDKSKSYIYKGEVKNNFTGNYGLYNNYSKEIKYEGDWLNNRREGIGIATYKDGSRYEGEYKNGVKHGIGTYIWADGSIYEGEWKYNLMDGYGIYTFKDGSFCSGFWFSNQMNGFGKFTLPEIKCYIGFFKKDNKNGFGLIFWYKQKKAFIGYWKNNKQDGLGKFISDEKIRYGSWKEGSRETNFEKNEFFSLLNEKRSTKIYIDIFEMDYDQLKEYISNHNYL